MKGVITGVNPATLTPFAKGGRQIDEGAFVRLLQFLIAAGVDGLYVAGTTGEFPLLSLEERKRLAALAVKAAKHQAKVVVQTGCVSTKDTIALTAHARELGADAAGVVTPYYYKCDEASLLAHYGEVARSVPDFPLYVYNIPSFAGNDLKPALLKELRARHDNIVGIKDTTRDLERFQEYLAALSPRKDVIMGTDTLILPSLVLGGVGNVSAVANVIPEVVVSLYRSFKAGKLKEAAKHQASINRLKQILKIGAGLASYKGALPLRGLEFGGERLPHRALERRELLFLKKKMEEAGFL